VGVREIAAGVNPATHVYGDKPGSKIGLMMMKMLMISYFLTTK